MYLQKTLLAIGLTVALTHSVRLQADSCSVGGYSDSSASADSWGGVSLNKTAELLLELEDVEGAIFDPATSQIIFYGKKRIQLPEMDMDDLNVAIRSIYGYGDKAPQDPGVSIGTEPSEVEGQLKVRYDGQTRKTKFGQIMFDADLRMKQLASGKSNITGEPVTSQVAGYRTLLDRVLDNPELYADQSEWSTRMWFVPDEVRLSRSADGGAMKIDKVSLKLLNESTFESETKTSNIFNDPASTAFSEHFTNNYDKFATEFAAFKDLKRLAKITGIIKWIKNNDIPMDISFVDDYEPVFVNTPDLTPSILVSDERDVAGMHHKFTYTGGVNFNLNDDNYEETDTAGTSELREKVLTARNNEEQFSWDFKNDGQQYHAVSQSFSRSKKDGHISWSATDMTFPVAGNHTLSLTRYYSSFNEKTAELGRGWWITPYGLRFSDDKKGYKTEATTEKPSISFRSHYRIFVRTGSSEMPYTLAGVSSNNNPFYTNKDSPVHLLYSVEEDRYILNHNNGSQVSFNKKGKLTAVTDINKVSLSYYYNNENVDAHLIKIQHQNKRKIELVYENGQLEQVKGPGGSLADYSYNSENMLSKITSDCGRVVSLGYDSEKRLNKIINGRGDTVFSANYDDYNRASKQSYAAKAQTQNKFDLESRMGNSTDSNGVTIKRFYDDEYRLLTSTDSEGRQYDLTWNTSHGPASFTDPMRNTTSYQYDRLGNVTKVTDAQEKSSQYRYNNASNLIYSENSQGQGTYAKYDKLNRLIALYSNAKLNTETDKVAVDSDFVTHYEYDAQGNVLKVQQGGVAGNQQTQTATYDSNGMPTSITSPTGITQSLEYDERSRLIRRYETTETIETTLVSYKYDKSDHVIKVTTPAGIINYEYDENGNLISQTDDRLHVTGYTYNADNLLQEVTDAEGGTTQYSYDIHGNITKITLPNGLIRNIGYDKLDRQTNELWVDTRVDSLFNAIEEKYPTYFPNRQESSINKNYYLRYYPETGNYMGTKDGRVYGYGNDFNGLHDAGTLEELYKEYEIPE
ncbi:MAG: RHS repeat protein [Methyloprofundus sp.]|nr:RHS repeat protein [Methyloprofundus sp.]